MGIQEREEKEDEHEWSGEGTRRPEPCHILLLVPSLFPDVFDLGEWRVGFCNLLWPGWTINGGAAGVLCTTGWVLLTPSPSKKKDHKNHLILINLGKTSLL